MGGRGRRIRDPRDPLDLGGRGVFWYAAVIIYRSDPGHFGPSGRRVPRVSRVPRVHYLDGFPGPSGHSGPVGVGGLMYRRHNIQRRDTRDPRDMIAIVPRGSREIHNPSYLIPLTQGPEGPGEPLIPNVPRVPRVPAGVPRVPTEAQKLLAINHTNADI